MISQITDNFFFIERGWLNANHFVFNGRRKILIDTGYKKNLPDTLDLIKQAGLEPAAVELIVSTHAHCDHVGGNRLIQELSGCEIAMHPIEQYYVQQQNARYTWWSYYDQQADFFNVQRALAEGDVVTLDDLELVVIHTPGHASGQISLYSPQRRFLISADALWDGDFGALTTMVEGGSAPFRQYETLEKLAGLQLEVVFPGHGKPIYDPTGAIDRSRRRLDLYMEQPSRMGRDQLKKLFLYVLLMKGGVGVADFFNYLMGTKWFPETVDMFFDGFYGAVYNQVMNELVQKKLVHTENGCYEATIRP